MSDKDIQVIKGFQVRIRQDELADDPDCYGNDDCFLGVIEHQNYRHFGRKGYDKSEAELYIPFGEGPWDFENTDYYDLAERVDTVEELREAYNERKRDGNYAVYPVRMFDYGSAGGRIAECDHDKAHGYVFVRLPYNCELEQLAHIDFDAQQLVDSLLKEWNTYLEGDVWCVDVLDSDGEYVESSSNVYGYKEANEVAKEMVSCLDGQTRKVNVIITYGTLPLPFPSRVPSDVMEVEVPLHVGHNDVHKYLMETVYAGHPDILHISVLP